MERGCLELLSKVVLLSKPENALKLTPPIKQTQKMQTNVSKVLALVFQNGM